MDINGKILIQRYNVGYVVTDYITNKKYAKETKESVLEVLRDILEIPEIFDNLLSSKTEKEPVSPAQEIVEKEYPPIKQIVETKISPPLQEIKKSAQVINHDGLIIPKFDYDPAQKKKIEGYTNIFVVELPDGRAMIQYKETHYYTTKEKVMNLPYPIPRKYFYGKGISTVAKTCLHAYRQYIHHIDHIPQETNVSIDRNAKNEKEVPVGDEQGTCDDIAFESCANNSPENCKFCLNGSRYEDKYELAAQKPAPPLMRATVSP